MTTGALATPRTSEGAVTCGAKAPSGDAWRCAVEQLQAYLRALDVLRELLATVPRTRYAAEELERRRVFARKVAHRAGHALLGAWAGKATGLFIDIGHEVDRLREGALSHGELYLWARGWRALAARRSA